MAIGAVGEFELIKRYFARPEIARIQGRHTGDLLGIGDDCALLDIPAGMQLAQSLDTLVEGVHFPAHCDPFALGYRALAVCLSDLAAMGAEPHSFTLGLTLPRVSELWLKEFSEGLAHLAQKYQLPLIGGDTTKGPLTLSLQVQGVVPKGQALLRSGAREGDLICVTGTLGDAAGALEAVLAGDTQEDCADAHLKCLLDRYWYPSPRLSAGQWLRQAGATSAIDISDGLLGDLRHILEASGMGAVIAPELLPTSFALNQTYGQDAALGMALTGGDDYELCFTIPREQAATLPARIPDDCPITCIGQITDESGIVRDSQGIPLIEKAYTHF